MKSRILLAAISLAAFAGAGTSSANDTVASINLGGLELSPSALISFPLPFPTVQEQAESLESGMYQEWDQLDFKTLIDGKPAPLSRYDVPMVRGKSVEARVKALGWPVLHWKDAAFSKRINALSDAVAAKLVAEGLLIDDAGSGGGAVRNLRPGWVVQTHVTRHQTFPAGETITVEHSYKPFVGGSASTSLNRDYRDQALKGPDGLAKVFCVDPAFLAAYDRRIYGTGARPDPGTTVVQSWFGYVLKSGANWAGPMKKFRMVVDKGKPGNLVSFCMNGAKKIGPTQFEVVKTDFEPGQDLDILLVEFITDGEGR